MRSVAAFFSQSRMRAFVVTDQYLQKADSGKRRYKAVAQHLVAPATWRRNFLVDGEHIK